MAKDSVAKGSVAKTNVAKTTAVKTTAVKTNAVKTGVVGAENRSGSADGDFAGGGSRLQEPPPGAGAGSLTSCPSHSTRWLLVGRGPCRRRVASGGRMAFTGPGPGGAGFPNGQRAP